jgi:hypothetical protein
LSANHAATTTPCLALLFQTGSRTSGVDAHRVHALQGFECREKTHRLNCDPVDVMTTVSSRRRPALLLVEDRRFGRGAMRTVLGVTTWSPRR